MHERDSATARVEPRLAFAVLIAAIALGVAGNALLRATPWGINFTIWVAVLGAAVIIVGRVEGARVPQSRAWLLGAMLFAALFAVRASEVLQALNAVAALACFGMVAFRTRVGAPRIKGMSEYAFHLAVSGATAVYGAAVLLFNDVDWYQGASEHQRRRVRSVLRGFAVAAPLLVLFGALFASADSFFRNLLADAVVLSPDEAASHLVLSIGIAWVSGSYLWSLLVFVRPACPRVEPPASVSLAATEAGIVFGLVDALFLAFVLVQFRYLFGGAGRVEASSTLTYAEYARHGFFELVVVVGIATALILVAHWFLAREQLTRRIFAALAALLIALVFVVMASALQRMRLYQDEYGLTELRVYTTAFMGFLALLLLWIAVTVLRGRRDRFALGLPAACALFVLSLVALSPGAFIAERNLSAGTGTRPVDTGYLLDLGPDAVPPLVRGLDSLPSGQACAVATEIRERYPGTRGGWRTWNLGRWRAERAAHDHQRLDLACAQPAAQ